MEELKLVLQTLATLADGAKEGFIWWLVIDRLVPCLLWATAGGGLLYVAWYLGKRLADGWDSSAQRDRETAKAIVAIKQIRGILGVWRYPSTQQDADFFYDSDFDATVNAVRVVAEQVAVTNARKQAEQKQ